MINSYVVNSTMGIDDKRNYPLYRTYSLGLSVQFKRKSMKTIIKYILAAPLMLCFSSCLEEHPKDQLDQEAIYNNADNIYKTQ